jgi:hypothetical protein
MLRPLTLSCCLLVASAAVGAEEIVGQRPYEMEWAQRTQDNHPALVDFENLEGWTVACTDAEASIVRSREQQLWGRYVAKLTYRGTGRKPVVTLKPPKPIPLPRPADSINFWIYGNNWAWVVDPNTPPVEIAVVITAADGREVRAVMGRVYWREWWVMHRRLTPEQLEMLKAGGSLTAILISYGRNQEDRVLYFDNLSVYQEKLAPLTFEPRPERGVAMFPGQGTGANTGPGKLPFPTREETILPDNLVKDFKVSLQESAGQYVFDYRGSDGHLRYVYRPQSGTLADVRAQWEGRTPEFQPMQEGGVWLVVKEDAPPVAPEKATLVRCRRVGDTVESTWRVQAGPATAEVTYTLRLWQKSLVVDVRALGGTVGEVRFGRAVGVENPRLVTLPYLTGGAQRPAVLVMGPPEKSCFLFGLVDHCRSNASLLTAVNEIAAQGVRYNAGATYRLKTDGRRNDCFERLFLTVSPRFEEILPNIPNPKSPWMHVAGERVWRAHGASNRDNDYAQWRRVARYGLSKILITDHETGWRDGGESFTFRTKAAPGRGGDESQAQYSRNIRNLGFRYGIYNNYTDYAPVNEFWDEDCVTRLSNGDWRTAWARCYNPKPSRAVEFEARLAPIIQKKFRLNTAYCDVHTAVTPWAYCDFDARVPGAGTFAATFYAYGEIMLHQKKTWKGPVYSEGNNHWYYCGLTDGNYGQDQVGRLAENPWLVDFDLRKLHPLCCNFGMGSPDMFYGRHSEKRTAENRDAWLDRFLAATLAFGHTGFLVMEGGMPSTARSYFALQQIHARYAQQAAVDIRYGDAQGRLWDTSAAVANDAFRRCQIVTRYEDGLEVFVNGHPRENWTVDRQCLPPNGWLVRDPSGKLTAWSLLVDGHRADYVDSPDYLYADGRGRLTRFPRAACDGQMAAVFHGPDSIEIIPFNRPQVLAIGLEGRSATAVVFDEQRQAIAQAETRVSRGLLHVVPSPKAFSYLLHPGTKPAEGLTSARRSVVPGEQVTVTGPGGGKFTVPADAKPEKVLWKQFGAQWIDFGVVPLVDAELSVADGQYRLQLTPHVPAAADAEVTLDGQSRRVRLTPESVAAVTWPFLPPTKEEVRPVKLTVKAGALRHHQTWQQKSQASVIPVSAISRDFTAGQCLRKHAEEALAPDSGAHVHRGDTSSGDVRLPSIAMHPPYKHGVGYSFALFEPIRLPASPKAALRAKIGKGDGSDPGDGILFQIGVVEPDGRRTIVAQRQWIQHAWTPLEADLTPWAGKQIRIQLISDVGPKDNSSGDWAAWSDPRIESLKPELQTTLEAKP